MIKFFRKIRQSLLLENKFRNYLLYAIGEIILVIIGILIALNLNNRNLQKKSDAKIEIILSDVLEELSSNIQTTYDVLNYFNHKDSLYYLIRDDKLTYNDYHKRTIPGMFWFDTDYKTIYFPQHNYDLLTLNLNAVPNKYKEVLKKLTALNSELKDNIYTHNKRMVDFTYETFEKEVKHLGFVNPRNKEDYNERINYMLNDISYKTRCDIYFEYALEVGLEEILKYRILAIDCYQNLATLLNKKNTIENLIINQELIDSYTGKYIGLNNNYNFEVIYENNQFFSIFRSLRYEVYPLSETKLVNSFGVFSTAVKQNNELLIKTNDGQIYKKIM